MSYLGAGADWRVRNYLLGGQESSNIDPFAEDVNLYLRMQGINGSVPAAPGSPNSLYDESILDNPGFGIQVEFSNAKTAFAAAATSLFCKGLNLLDATYWLKQPANVAADDRFSVNNGDWTFEILVSTEQNERGFLCDRNTASAATGWAFGDNQVRGNPGSGFDNDFLSWTEGLPTVFNEYAFERYNDMLRVYKNGVIVAVRAFTGFVTSVSSDRLSLATDIYGAFVERLLTGYVQMLRWTQAARYRGANYTRASTFWPAPYISAWSTPRRASTVALASRNGLAAVTTNWGCIVGKHGRNASDDRSVMIEVAGADAMVCPGMCNESFSATTRLFLGEDTNGVSYYGATGVKVYNNANIAYSVPYAASTKLLFRLHAGDITAYVWDGAQWVSRGVLLSGVTGIWFPAWSPGTANPGTRQATIDTSGATWPAPPPDGSSYWDVPGDVNPAV